jgi:chemotaxis protein CheD
MIEIEGELPEVYLQPGEFYIARAPAILKTVLGSCVAVTFWSPSLRIGALCHGVLPKCPNDVGDDEGYRYVDFAICDLARQFDRFGTFRKELQVKVFGGGDVLPVLAASRNGTVGYQNWRAALAALRDEGLRVIAQDLGDSVGRLIQFLTGTGEVLLRRLFAPSHAQGAVAGNTKP